MALMLVFVNKSNLAPVSDYSVQVMVGDGTEKGTITIHKSSVKGHTRADGWEKLVSKFMEELGNGEVSEHKTGS